ncbi:TPA: permease [Candidatus Micrarchaeota archaeon]|nr:permease [Candidatus Micrarchaeota archaeon]HIH31030.1 permease [Candidatus Micrarchaeota archaeon]
MGVLEDFAGWVVHSLLGMQQKEKLAEALNFFIYDTIKVFLLLAAMVFLVAIVRTYVTPQRVRKWLGGRKEGVGNVLAALLGVPTPFCSCSAVPLFIGFVESGVPLGITFSFLIASPAINEVAIALLLGMFGWKITALYIGTGLAIAIAAGMIIGRLKLEGEVEEFVYKIRQKKLSEKPMSWKQRLEFGKTETRDIVLRVAPFLVLGIGIGALMHGYVPVGSLSELAGMGNPLAVPIAVLVGVPLYSNAAGVLPIVQVLIDKGMAMGTALAFMMSVTALSLPEMIILRKVLKPKLIAIFAGILALSFIVMGLIFNAVIG